MSKRKVKSLEDSTFDNKLRSTDSINEILKYIRNTNKNAYKFYCRCFGRLQLTYGHHHLLPSVPTFSFPDDWDGDVDGDFFESFKYKCKLPKMLTKMKNVNGSDPLTGYMKIKEDWQSELMKLRVHADHLKHQYKRINDKVAQCPKVFVNLVKHYHSDPDPNFKSTYNWYYGGHGNLQLVTLNNRDYLLHSDFHYLYLSEFQRDSLTIMPHTSSYDCGKDKNILETITNRSLIALRMMFWVFILKLNVEDGDITIQLLKKLHFEIACIGISFDESHSNILYITQLDNSLTIVNTSRMTKHQVQLTKPKSLLNNWNAVISSDRFTYCHVTTENVSIYDKRTHESKAVLNKILAKTDLRCNRITSVKKYRDCLYVATYHNLLALDLRFNNFKGNALQRWTHNMESSPTYINVVPFENDRELICLSSQWCEDMILVVGDGNNLANGFKVSSIIPPYRPKSIMSTLVEARKSMMCSSLNNPLGPRLSTSISGMVLLDVNDKYTVLQHNSLGDVTGHVLYPGHLELFVQDDSKEVLNKWAKSYVRETEPLLVSGVYDFSSFLKNLERVPDDTDLFSAEFVDGRQKHFSEMVETFGNEVVDSSLLDVWRYTLDELKEAAKGEEEDDAQEKDAGGNDSLGKT